VLKASRFMQLDLESGAWLTSKKKPFQKAPLIRGGGVGNSGHRSASRANPTLGIRLSGHGRAWEVQKQRPRCRRDPAAGRARLGRASGADGSLGAPLPLPAPLPQPPPHRSSAPSRAASRLFAGCTKAPGDLCWVDAERRARPELPQHPASLLPWLRSRHSSPTAPPESPPNG